MNVHNENGSALIIVLVVLVCVTLLGISSMNSSDFESKILSNFKNHEITFHLTEGSVMSTSKIIYNLLKSKDLTAVPFEYLTGSGTKADSAESIAAIADFHRRVLNFPSSSNIDLDATFKYGINTVDGEIDMNEGVEGSKIDVDVNIDFDWRNTQTSTGSSVEFMQGGGSAMRVEKLYTITATGTGKNGSTSKISVLFNDIL